MRHSTWVGVALAVAAIACDQPASSPTALRDQGASFGKALTNPTATLYISNDASSLFRGDGIAAYLEDATSTFAGSSRYKDGECGVMVAVFAVSGGGDMVFGSAANQDHKCAAFPRKGRMTFALIHADGTVTVDRTETTGFGGNLG